MTAPPGPRQSDVPPPDETASQVDELEAEARADAEARHRFERILPELIRKGFEAGRVPLERVSESIFPKDIASTLVSQLGDVRSGIVKAVAQEVGRFLREADIASEVRKVLTGVDVEASVRLRFKARDDGTLQPNLKLSVREEPDTEDEPRPAERRRRR